MGLGIALIYILGILSVIIFLAIRKRCRNRKAQAWFSSNYRSPGPPSRTPPDGHPGHGQFRFLKKFKPFDRI